MSQKKLEPGSEYDMQDLDGDGVASNNDLLLFLPYAGQQSECHPTDFNFDGETDINDVILLLNQFGYSCDGILIEDNFTTNVDVTEGEVTDVYGLCKIGSPLFFDLAGRKVNSKGRVAPGIYLVVQSWSNGNVTTEKIFLLLFQ